MTRDESTKTHVEGGARHGRPRVLALWEGGFATADLPERGQLVFGRAAECDVCIDDDSVSRRHAVLHLGPDLAIEDLGSSNGTRVEGVRLAPRVRRVVGMRDRIELGAARLLLEGIDAAPAAGEAIDTVVRDPKMMQVYRLIEQVAPTDLCVLITGETGVGKELAAEALHRLSSRAAGPFVPINCATLPHALVESELFGHERGAFTGATQAKMGLLQATNGGTVLLDEVGELPLGTQAKLLRVIESHQVMPLGGLRTRPLDVRFVAATNRDLPASVAAGTFRQDLYFRLNAVTIHVPPLRERRSEIAPLAEAFALRMATRLGRSPPILAGDALAVLEGYGWPGNIRELRNAVERAVAVCREAHVTREHLPPEIQGAHPLSRPVEATVPPPPQLKRELEAIERQRIVDALERCGGHQGRAAEILGISRRTLISRLDAHGLPRPRKKV
ncbi:MAG TPA: sigma 54-interacting transcriptional regulator [Polyangiaceae bacterium]|jgi:two-component system, NtrC family, response regulator AtoC|nr:sigma 54-interacting transcriptional regulator [Polyangiaceae bacterium]